jgi:hypothetical protein
MCLFLDFNLFVEKKIDNVRYLMKKMLILLVVSREI